MKRIVMVVLLAAGITAVLTFDKYAFDLPGAGRIVLWKDEDLIYRNTMRFLEDIRFKDFAHAALFSSDEDRARKDIPTLLEKKFVIKPEFLDISSCRVRKVELMETGKRAKAYCTVHVKALNTGREKDVELILYWKRKDSGWYMDLQSSL